MNDFSPWSYVDNTCIGSLFISRGIIKIHTNSIFSCRCTCQNVTHFEEVAGNFELCEFIQDMMVMDFDLKGVFMAHLNSIGYYNLTRIFTP